MMMMMGMGKKYASVNMQRVRHSTTMKYVMEPKLLNMAHNDIVASIFRIR